MNRKTFLIFAIVVSSSLSLQTESTQAQDGWRNVLPRGRLIKRLRDDLNGGKPFVRNPFSEPAPSQPTRAPSKAPTKAPSNKPRTPVTSPSRATGSASRIPSPAKQPPKPTIKLKSGTVGSGVQGSGVRSLNDGLNVNGSSATASVPKEATVHNSKDFGMTVAKLKDSILISNVVAGGNAAEAGLQRGDVILGVGGAKLISIGEFDAIAESMRGGDRVEFEIARRGKKTKEFVQFGKPAPIKPTDVAPAANPAGAQGSSSRGLNSQRRAIGDYKSNDPIEPLGGEGMQSILDSSPAAGSNRSGQIELELPPLDLEPPTR